MGTKLTISRKIILAWGLSMVAALVAIAMVFQFLMFRYNETIEKEKALTAFTTLEQQVKNRIENMRNQIISLSNREDIVSGVNLISKYQDKENYDAIAFDGEKRKLATQLRELAFDYSALVIYDTDMDPIALYHRNSPDLDYIAFTSYIDGKQILLSANSETQEEMIGEYWHDLPKLGEVPKDITISLHEINGEIKIDVIAPIIRKRINGEEEFIGQIRIDDNLSGFVSNDANSLSGIQASLYSKRQLESIILAPHSAFEVLENDLENYFKGNSSLWVETSNGFWSIHRLSIENTPDAFVVLTIEKQESNTELDALRDSVLYGMLGVLIILIPLGQSFIRRVIINPIQGLLSGVTQVSQGKYEALHLINSKDEFGSLARSFEEMAREIQVREQKLVDILRIAPEGIVAVDEDFKVTIFNQGAEAIFGYSEVEVIGQQLDMLLPKKYRKGHNEKIANFDASKNVRIKMTTRGEISGLRKSGEVFPAAASISKLQTGSERVFTVLIQDITQRKKIETDLIRAKGEAEKANKAKSHFLASMSHELRTPLNAILGMSAMMQGEYFGELGAKYKEYANDIVVSGEHLLALVDEILDISAIESGNPDITIEELSVSEIVDNCILIVNTRAKQKNIQLESHIPDDISSLYADKQSVKKILLNIISNAIKFTHNKGKVDVSVFEDDQHVIFLVKDTGLGIPADKIEGLMEPFTRHDQDSHIAVEGWGLGLAISKSLMDHNNGTIKIESEEGKGTDVFLSFPKHPTN